MQFGEESKKEKVKSSKNSHICGSIKSLHEEEENDPFLQNKEEVAKAARNWKKHPTTGEALVCFGSLSTFNIFLILKS